MLFSSKNDAQIVPINFYSILIETISLYAVYMNNDAIGSKYKR